MGKSKPNQVRYNAKISEMLAEIRLEKERFVEGIKKDIQALLERRSPEDMGMLKGSWRVIVTQKSKLSGHSIAKLSEARPIVLGLSIESTSRHAPMQMFGWEAVPGQLLTGYRYGGKWKIMRASSKIFSFGGKPKTKRRKKRQGRIRTFLTRGGYHKPNKDLAWEGSSHSVSSEIKRIVTRRLKECKFIGVASFTAGDGNIAKVWTLNTQRHRIAEWMKGTLNVELNSRATKGVNGSYSPSYKGRE